MPKPEELIYRHLSDFLNIAQKRGYNIEGLTALKTTYITALYNKRKLNLPDDILLHMFEYLCLPAMIAITSTSTKYYKLYPDIWGIAQHQEYPYSLIPASDYIDIRANIALDYFYAIVRNNLKNDPNWLKINGEENHMVKINAELEYLKPNHMSYEIRRITHKNELNAGNARNLVILDDTTDSRFSQFLFSFLAVSKRMTTGIPYFTIKQDIDSRLYGWDPLDNPFEYETTRKWITGEYHDSWENGVYDGNDDDSEFEFKRASVYGVNDYVYSRRRIRPDYC